jgi:hypothetical protein
MISLDEKRTILRPGSTPVLIILFFTVPVEKPGRGGQTESS